VPCIAPSCALTGFKSSGTLYVTSSSHAVVPYQPCARSAGCTVVVLLIYGHPHGSKNKLAEMKHIYVT
jgi:hypothetical protein